MDDKSNDDVKPVAAKSIDPAALEMLAHAEGCGLDTAFSRADTMKPCPIGESGACCRICSMGPCRLVGKDAEEKTGICGADMGTIASRHFARQVAGGVAAHSDHGRDMAMTLRAVAMGEAAGYKVKDEQKLHTVAGYLGIPTSGREVNEIALDVADVALAQFGQHARRDRLHQARDARSARPSGASWGSPLAPSTARSSRSCTAPTRASTSTPRTSSSRRCAAPWPTAGAAPC